MGCQASLGASNCQKITRDLYNSIMSNSFNSSAFLSDLWQFYCQNGRHDMTWRQDTRPYYIFVSEVMLQQTQVERVKQRFAEFVAKFPDWQTLAEAKQSNVVMAWQGLGYNRRALYLQQSAQTVMREYNGILPNDVNQLEQLAGIGPNTAGAIVAFAYDMPVVFIETNIRRVLIYYFFSTKENVEDKQLLLLLEEIVGLLATTNFTPRTFYWAMMDYGTHIKTLVPNPNRQSKHYSKQSRFEGSDRQLRGQILRELLHAPQTISGLYKKLGVMNTQRVDIILAGLNKEGFITIKAKKVQLR